MIYYKNSDELEHHGIMGMKWGVRRYQNKDGSLTPLGEARYLKVGGSERLKKKDTKAARDIFAKNYVTNKTASKANLTSARRHADKAAEYIIKKNDPRNSLKKSNRYDVKMRKEIDKAAQLRELSIAQKEIQKISEKKIKDIDSGKIQAGRDFVVQRDLNLWLFPVLTPAGGWLVSAIGDVEKTVVEKKK